MKKRIGITIIGLLAILVVMIPIVATLNGEIVWFVKELKSNFTVNGIPEKGYSHFMYHSNKKRPYVMGQARVITIWHSKKKETFWIIYRDKAPPELDYCADWIAPNLFLFPVSTVESGACMNVIPNGETEIPGYVYTTVVSAGENQIEFRTSDGRDIKATW